MPIISMFYGIIIRMYLLDNRRPRKQLRLVQAWVELRRDELMADWELAISDENPYKIAPL